jgi:hypothetical protein
MILAGIVVLLVLLTLGVPGKALEKLAARVCLAVLLVPAALIAVMVLSFFWRDFAMEHFYRARPILQAMWEARDVRCAFESAAAQAALLQHVPVGTDATTALAALSVEGFGCRKPPASSDGHVECGLRIASPIGYTTWVVDLQFGDSGVLAGAKVSQWNISL